MKKLLFFIIAITLISWTSVPNHKNMVIEDAYFCGGGYYPDEEYYNLFAQEIINVPKYTPFLLSYDSFYYTPKKEQNIKNENIEDWQKYLDITYEQAHYLVFKSARKDLRNLLKQKTIEDKKLAFIDSQFIKKHKQALLYLSYAKYLEPYMAVISNNNEYYWGDKPEYTVADLDYEAVIKVLKQSWNAETDQELKLRYGYQLVRLAHYKLNFDDAISYFKSYVESLNYKGIMYYYALDQKGGAERGKGNYMQANYDFFQFFSHTKNFKEKAYNSMLVTQDLDFEALLQQAKTKNEINDIYLILGRKEFNNPISSFEKIIETSPNAVQAKVLMARAINQLERDILKLSYSCYYDCKEHGTDKRLPIVTKKETFSFLNQTLAASKQQATNINVKDKNYWNLTTAYLYFTQKEYENSKLFLEKVNTSDANYLAQKNKLILLLNISEQNQITPEFEEKLITKYKNELLPSKINTNWAKNTTRNFILDILANRYLMQGDTAKSFLLHNNIKVMEYGPDLKIINAIENFYYKKDKSTFENFVVENNVEPNFDFAEYVAIMKSTIHLRNGKFKTALNELNKITPKVAHSNSSDGYNNIPNTIFGYNKIECFGCLPSTTMATDYLEDFKFIPALMNKQKLAVTLVKLEKLASKKNELAIKANYLIGNFFFNTSIYGYYRHVLAYENDNSNNEKFRNFEYKSNIKISSNYYFKDYSWYAIYNDDFNLPLTYLNKAINLSKDNELIAKALFTAAKCEQGQYYNDKNIDDKKAINSKIYFNKLKEYNSTGFYDEVVSNCLYFSYYVSN